MTNDRMGDCGHIRSLLNEYIDGELRGEELDALERHIAVCDTCRAEFDELNCVKKLVCESALPSPSITSRVMEQINSGKVKMQKTRRMFIPFGTLAALAAMLVFIALNKNVLNIFGDKTSMDNIDNAQSVSQSYNSGADTVTAEAGQGEEMHGMLALPGDAQFAPPINDGAPAEGSRQEKMEGASEAAFPLSGSEQNTQATTEQFGDNFQIEMDMNALAQKIKEESGFSVPTARTYSVHLPDDYSISQLFEGMAFEEDSGIYVLGASDEQALIAKLDLIPDALYNSYAETSGSDKIAVIIING